MAVGLMLSGCGSEGTTTTNPPAGDGDNTGDETSFAGRTLTVGIWGGNDQETAAINTLKANFEEMYGCTVDLKVYTDYNTQIQADFIGQTAPDCFYVDGSMFPFYGSLGVMDPLDPAEYELDKFYPNLIEAFTNADGEVLCVPKDVSTLATYYNIDLLEACGYTADDTPDDYDEYAAFLTAAANIGNIFLMRQFFMNFPHDVAEAAEIDGLNRYGVFFRIAMPLARPTIATTAIFGFMGFWNAFTAPMLYIKTDTKYTLTLGLQSFQSQNAGTMWNQVMAAACISVVPIIIIYLIFNKFFLVGLRMDGEK